MIKILITIVMLTAIAFLIVFPEIYKEKQSTLFVWILKLICLFGIAFTGLALISYL